jgi:hypothetical protein
MSNTKNISLEGENINIYEPIVIIDYKMYPKNTINTNQGVFR